MNRRDFTLKIAQLILEMRKDGNYPVLQDVHRSTEEQQRLYSIGRTQKADGVWVETGSTVTQKDGILKVSDHQIAIAADIYFVVTRDDGSVFVDYSYEHTLDLAKKYHDLWETMGGMPMIAWDLPHYAGK
jgi:hypothetical protein